MKSAILEKDDKLIRITAWIPRRKLNRLMKEQRGHNQSEVLRMLIDNELERLHSARAHEELYGIAMAGDFLGSS